MVELNLKSMDNKIILTIGRQFGSGGREIGQRLAKELGISYYDKELITVAARESGLCEDVFEKADERASSGLSYAFTMGYSSFMGGMFTPYNDILSNDGLFKIQSDAIRKLAETESCVLVGRCADYILRDDPACLSFFIHSSVESRVQKTVERHGVTVEEAKNAILKIWREKYGKSSGNAAQVSAAGADSENADHGNATGTASGNADITEKTAGEETTC